jgi:histidinol-phosphate aminotransferase
MAGIELSAKTRRIPVYPLAGAYNLGDAVMLASNETPFGPLEGVVDAARHAVIGANRYPDPSYAPLRQAIADRYGVPYERIALGEGSCDILISAGEALLEPGAEVVYAWPSFSVYPHLAAAAGAREIRVPLDSGARHQLDAIAAEITVATRLVLICNPNNPTSTALPLEEIERFLAKVPDYVCVLLDEAYVEFSLSVGDTYASVELLDRYPNLVILRTFSKVYGLAGLRVGYALSGNDAFRVAVDQVRQPFYLTSAAVAAAVEALKHQDEVERRVEQTVATRVAVTEQLREIGLWVADSDANFLWVRVDDSDEPDDAPVVAALQERGVLVRAGGALGGPGYVRVTVGTTAENERFIAALREVLGR